MRILVLGGSAFLGRAAVEEALTTGHDVATFNRGVSGPDHPGVEAIRGDRTRDADLEQVRGRQWDVVVDTSGYVPDVVGRSARLLAPTTGSYVFVSSVNAYPGWPAERVTEGSPTHECRPDARADDGDYGVLKVGCERAVRDAFGDRALIVRSGLLVGPYDNTGRVPWWLHRSARGGQVLAPGDPGRPMQVVDVRDQARWFVDRALQGRGGTFNAGGPGHNTTMGELLGACVEATGSGAELVWADDGFLTEHGARPWDELPLWTPGTAEFGAVWDADSSAAVRAGLDCRPVAESVRDTWAWLDDGGAPSPKTHQGVPAKGIEPSKERSILDDWLTRHQSQDHQSQDHQSQGRASSAR